METRRMKTITILPDGSVSFLGECPVDLPLLNAVRRRVSKIEPKRFWKKKAFQVLRLVAGDTGRVAAFTRTWSGKWTARILATGETYTAETRAECIRWEIEQLQ
jgi:hypothetical protein